MEWWGLTIWIGEKTDMANNNGQNLGRMLKQRRLMIMMTLRGLAQASGISSHRERRAVPFSLSSAQNSQAVRFWGKWVVFSGWLPVPPIDGRRGEESWLWCWAARPLRAYGVKPGAGWGATHCYRNSHHLKECCQGGGMKADINSKGEQVPELPEVPREDG